MKKVGGSIGNFFNHMTRNWSRFPSNSRIKPHQNVRKRNPPTRTIPKNI